jgi:hypothetical protein
MKSVVRRSLQLFLNFFQSNNCKDNQMLNINKTWKKLHKTKTLTSAHVVECSILRALNKSEDENRCLELVLRDLIKAFPPRTNKNALANGYKPLQALRRSIILAQYDGIKENVLGESFKNLSAERAIKYVRLLRLLWIDSDKCEEYFSRRYVYTFVRQDISPEYQLVQAAHATFKMGHVLGSGQINNDINPSEVYFSVIGVENEKELYSVRHHLVERDIQFSSFYEPDIGGQMTAITTEPIPIRERGDLLKYKRLVFKTC